MIRKMLECLQSIVEADTPSGYKWITVSGAHILVDGKSGEPHPDHAEKLGKAKAEQSISAAFEKSARENPPTKQNVAENALRDFFLRKRHQRTGGKVDEKVVQSVLRHPAWHKLYGKKELKNAFDDLVKDGYVKKEGGNYRWEY